MSFSPPKSLPATLPEIGGGGTRLTRKHGFELLAAAGLSVAIALRLKTTDGGMGIAAGIAFFVVSIALLLKIDDETSESRPLGSSRLIGAGWAAQVVGVIWMVGFGSAGLSDLAVWGFAPVAWGVGILCCPNRDVSTQLAVAPAVGVAVTMFAMTVVGTVHTLSGTWLYAGAALILAVSVLGTLDGIRGSREEKRPRPSMAQIVAVVAMIATIVVGVWVTLLPYTHLHPAVPLGRDFHHPISVRAVVETGKAAAREPEIAEVQPDTFAYGAGAVARVARVDVLTLFKVFPTVLWSLSALTVFFIGQALFGTRAALLGVLAYTLWSYQPRQTLADGSILGVVVENALVPAALFAVLRSVQQPSFRSSLLAGGLMGATIQFHFLSPTRLLAALVLFFILAVALLPERVRTLRTFALTGSIGFVLGLPYSIRYSTIYAQTLYARATGGVVAAHDATFPSLDFPRGLGDILGSGYFLLALFAVAVWVSWGPLANVRKSTWMWGSAWIAAVLLAAVSRALVVPERDVRSLAFPLALLIGWVLTVTIDSFGRFRPRLLSIIILGLLTLLILPNVGIRSLDVGSINVYATPSDLRLLQSLRLERIEGRLGTDESGLWAQWFVKTPPVVVNGGPEGFRWYGEPIRSRMQTLYEVLQQPCAPDALDRLDKIGVTHLYLGPPPRHWTVPGYTYIPGAQVAACNRNFEVVRHDLSTDAWLLRVNDFGSNNFTGALGHGRGGV